MKKRRQQITDSHIQAIANSHKSQMLEEEEEEEVYIFILLFLLK